MTDLEKAIAAQREAKFSPGDVVKVRGSSVLMTVDTVNTQNHFFKEDGSAYKNGEGIRFMTTPSFVEFNGQYGCIWFDHEVHLQRSVFDEELLDLVPEDKIP